MCPSKSLELAAPGTVAERCDLLLFIHHIHSERVLGSAGPAKYILEQSNVSNQFGPVSVVVTQGYLVACRGFGGSTVSPPKPQRLVLRNSSRLVLYRKIILLHAEALVEALCLLQTPSVWSSETAVCW